MINESEREGQDTTSPWIQHVQSKLKVRILNELGVGWKRTAPNAHRLQAKSRIIKFYSEREKLMEIAEKELEIVNHRSSSPENEMLTIKKSSGNHPELYLFSQPYLRSSQKTETSDRPYCIHRFRTIALFR
jgi:hypothetical protein